jgi:Lrp/AsnC family transcriptional regulator for asnA, asnC and gidA
LLFFFGLQAGFDEVDREILRMMQADARISYAEMGKRLKVPESTVRYRVKRLVDAKVIRKMMALLDPRKVGFDVSAVVMVKVDPKYLTEALRQMASFEEAQHVFQTTGEYDIICVIHVRDTKALNEFRQRAKMLKGVKDVVVWVVTGLVKIDPALPVC